MTLPKSIVFAGIIVVSAVTAHADSVASANSVPLSQLQNLQRGMITNRAAIRVAGGVEFDSSLRKLPHETGPLVMRSEGAHPPEIGREQQEHMSAILPEPNSGVLFGVGLVLLLLMQRALVKDRQISPAQKPA